MMTAMQFPRSPANCLSHCRQRYQDTASADQIETSLTEAYPTYIRHSQPISGLRYRSESCRALQPAKPASRSGLPVGSAVFSAAEYEKSHQRHIQQRLQHRLAVASARGDQSLVQLLQREMQRAG